MRKLISLALLVITLLNSYDNQITWPWERDHAVPDAPTAEVPTDVPVEPPVETASPEPPPEFDELPELTPTPTPEPYDYGKPVAEREAVENEWFADAVFIGDSRTDGLRLYSGIRGVDFISYKGLTVFDVMNDKAVIQAGEEKIGPLQALTRKQYAKVYVSLGVNELGYNHDAEFADTYRALVDKVKELQPDADIYLQSLIPVSTEKCAQTKQPYYVTNEKIAVYNAIIETIAAEKEVYYLNVKEVMVDENGELPLDASSDGIHFYRGGYITWYEYLKTHTVEDDAE